MSLNPTTSSPTTSQQFTQIDLNNRSLNSSGYTSFSGKSDEQQNSLNNQQLMTPVTGINIDSLKEWSKSTFKCTRQMLYEKLGKTTRTIDPEVQSEIDTLKDTRKKYEHLMHIVVKMSLNFNGLIQAQKSLGDLFGELAQKTPEINEQLMLNGELQKQIAKQSDTLEKALEIFASTLNTLCNKTMEDTFVTIRTYELARLEYDAYKNDVDTLKIKLKVFNSSQRQSQYTDLERKYQVSKQRYEKLRNDVLVKIKFLDENRCGVMEKQLFLLQNAINAYFTGNHKQVDLLIKQFNNKARPDQTNNNTQKSFLEYN